MTRDQKAMLIGFLIAIAIVIAVILWMVYPKLPATLGTWTMPNG
jgi:hypothetical protein